MSGKKVVNPQVKKEGVFQNIRKNYVLYLFLVLPCLFFIIFKYIPMVGNIIAFRRYTIGHSIFGEGAFTLQYFKAFLGDSTFWKVFQNTIVLSMLVLGIMFPMPIIFALLMNEIGAKKFKGIVQSITIIPRFFSVVVVITIFTTLLSPSIGKVNEIITSLGGSAIFFMNDASWFRAIYLSTEIWQMLGWNSIIYMAVLASADHEQYEAAMVDGANRIQQIIHITIPALLPTVAINLVMSVGTVINLGFEKNLLLYQPNIAEVADVIQLFVYRMGLLNRNYSYATAVGLFQAVISLSLLYFTNKLVNKYWGCGLW